MNVLGLTGNPANSIVAQLDNAMGRGATDRAKGNSLGVESQLEGLMAYLNNNNVRLNLKHQGLSPFGGDPFTGANNVTVGALTSVGQGTIVDPNFIFNEIVAGAAAEYTSRPSAIR